MSDSNLPVDAQTFLARLATLPDAAWDEILVRTRLGLHTLPRFFWRVLRDAVTLPFRRRQAPGGGFVFSEAAAKRVFELFKARVFPERLGSRGLALVVMTVQAICSRASLTPRQLDRIYAPFEPFIPLTSLAPPDSGPRLGGA